jgi:hypothetical protein
VHHIDTEVTEKRRFVGILRDLCVYVEIGDRLVIIGGPNLLDMKVLSRQ